MDKLFIIAMIVVTGSVFVGMDQQIKAVASVQAHSTVITK